MIERPITDLPTTNPSEPAFSIDQPFFGPQEQDEAKVYEEGAFSILTMMIPDLKVDPQKAPELLRGLTMHQIVDLFYSASNEDLRGSHETAIGNLILGEWQAYGKLLDELERFLRKHQVDCELFFKTEVNQSTAFTLKKVFKKDVKDRKAPNLANILESEEVLADFIKKHFSNKPSAVEKLNRILSKIRKWENEIFRNATFTLTQILDDNADHYQLKDWQVRAFSSTYNFGPNLMYPIREYMLKMFADHRANYPKIHTHLFVVKFAETLLTTMGMSLEAVSETLRRLFIPENPVWDISPSIFKSPIAYAKHFFQDKKSIGESLIKRVAAFSSARGESEETKQQVEEKLLGIDASVPTDCQSREMMICLAEKERVGTVASVMQFLENNETNLKKAKGLTKSLVRDLYDCNLIPGPKFTPVYEQYLKCWNNGASQLTQHADSAQPGDSSQSPLWQKVTKYSQSCLTLMKPAEPKKAEAQPQAPIEADKPRIEL